MDVGIFLNFQAPLGSDQSALADGLVRQTRAAREAGFDMVAPGQHFLADYDALQPLPLLGRLAAEAGSMNLGTCISVLPLQQPVRLAEEYTTLDAIADGDIIAGVGAGYRDVEFDSFDIDKRERGQRLAEGIRLMNKLWTEEDVTYDGDIYSVDGVTMNPRPDTKPQAWVGANSKPAVARAARVGDALLATNHLSVSELEPQVDIYRSVREKEADDPGTVAAAREAFVAETTEEALEVGQRYLKKKYERYFEWGQYDEMEVEINPKESAFSDIAEDRFLLGTPEEVSADIERFRDTLGDDVTDLVVRLQWPGMSHDRAIECIELMGDEVLPTL
jgi:alkanesulfonate monooxygenase SsuD/methylene tetrahydromethanopterin reductase-like flavin-dependent oxidoreductase (luciferase family)